MQNASLDQPQINVSLSLSANGQALQASGIDPFTGQPTLTINYLAFLDTGASGILLSHETATAFGIAKTQFGGNDVIYSDVGVGGQQDFNVSDTLFVRLARNNPTVNIESTAAYDQQVAANTQITLPPIKPDPFPDPFVYPIDIVGMPAMIGKVVVIDSSHLNHAIDQFNAGDFLNLDFNDLSLRTYVYNPGTAFVGGDSNPGIPTTNLHVALSSASFDRFTKLSPSGATGPSLADNPFIGPNPVAQLQANPPIDNTPKVKIALGDRSVEGSFLLDTGAGASMISNALAEQLNIFHSDPLDPSSPLELHLPGGGVQAIDQFQLSFSGIGANSTVTRPGFFLDSLLVRTQEASSLLASDPNNLNFLHVPVLVNDVSVRDEVTGTDLTLDGIFGMNMLTATADASGDIFSDFDLSSLILAHGAFDYITYDQINGTLGLTLNAAVPEPSTAVLAALGTILALASLKRKTAKAAPCAS